MLKNYATIALRTLLRQRGYAFLNVAGLAAGFACCLAILLYVRDELQYDRWHEHADRIYRVVASTSGDGQPTNANGSWSPGPALDAEFAEVVRAVRFRAMGHRENRVVANGERRFAEAGLFFADSTVFDVFTLPFTAGDPATALVGPNRIVITERAAEKLFPEGDALGKTIQVDAYNVGAFMDFQVTGIMKNLPAQSHMQFDYLASWSTQTDMMGEGWGLEPVYTYVRLAPEADAGALAAKLPAFLARHVGPDHWLSLHLQALTDIHLTPTLRADPQPQGDVRYLYLFGAVAGFILLLACINYMNLATAQAARRAREVGVRKVLGAYRSQLVRQFVGEAVLLSVAATVVALVLLEGLVGVLNTISGKRIVVDYVRELPLVAAVLGLGVAVGVAAGSYPAFFVTRFSPARVLKGAAIRAGGDGALLRRGLVVFQFAVSTGLIICTGVVHRQMRYVSEKNLGFDREQIVVLPMNDELRRRFDAFRSALAQDGAVLQTAASEQVPARAGNGGSYVVEGLAEPVGETRMFVTADFNRAYGTEVIAGRDFSEAHPTDAQQAYVVNEAFVREMGWTSQEAVGKKMQLQRWDERPEGRIVGVVRDFHLTSLREPVWSMVMNLMPLERMNFVSVRIASGRSGEAMEHLRRTWAAFAPSYPFDYYFLDDDYERLHQADRRLQRVFGAFTVLALFIASLGLFGLAAFTAEQRTKEIGIRKVLGATVPDILRLLSGEFVRLVVIAVLLASPLAYFAMRKWLEGFAFQAGLTPGVFIAAGAGALALTLLTVGYRSVKAATADPVKSLRYE